MRRTTRLQPWELWTLITLLLMGAALRLLALADVPPGLRYDELLNYRMAMRVLAGERPIYFTESWGHEPLFHYAQAAVIALTKDCDWSLRLPAALFGLFGVLTAWLAARQLCGARIAIVTAAALTVSFWSVFYSRQGLRAIAVTPLSCLAVYFIWRGAVRPPGRRRRAIVDFVLAGACMGGLFYVYIAARVFPLLPLVWALYLTLFHRSRFRQAWHSLSFSVLVALLLAAPLISLLCIHPEVEQRVGQLTEGWTALRAGDLRPTLHLGVQAAGMFFWQGQRDWLYNVHGRPVFDPLTGACFLLGVLICIWRWRQARFALLLLWLAIGVVPAAVAPPAASLIHAIAAQAPAYVVMAVGVEALWRVLQKRHEWAGILLAAVLLGFHGALSAHAYFVTWANAPEVRQLYQGGISAVAQDLDAHNPPGPVVIGAPYINRWHPWNVLGFDLALRREDLAVRWFNPAGAWIWPAGTDPVTYYFPTDPLGVQSFQPELQELFMADATMMPGAGTDFVVFRVTHPAALEERLDAVDDAALAWPPDLARLPSPELPLAFGDRLELLGIELLGGGVRAGDEVGLVTYWEVRAADPAPVVAFVHLTSDGQDIWGQQDWLDVRPAGLQPGDRFAQVHMVPVEPEAPPGRYHVQLGLYNPDTLVRLTIATGADVVADRVWVEDVVVWE
jgi:4-amino-4-deoxy-L-arabinose transferase-like glycosyltransferase